MYSGNRKGRLTTHTHTYARQKKESVHKWLLLSNSSYASGYTSPFSIFSFQLYWRAHTPLTPVHGVCARVSSTAYGRDATVAHAHTSPSALFFSTPNPGKACKRAPPSPLTILFRLTALRSVLRWAPISFDLPSVACFKFLNLCLAELCPPCRWRID